MRPRSLTSAAGSFFVDRRLTRADGDHTAGVRNVGLADEALEDVVGQWRAIVRRGSGGRELGPRWGRRRAGRAGHGAAQNVTPTVARTVNGLPGNTVRLSTELT